jgi:hypothetical protein
MAPVRAPDARYRAYAANRRIMQGDACAANCQVGVCYSVVRVSLTAPPTARWECVIVQLECLSLRRQLPAAVGPAGRGRGGGRAAGRGGGRLRAAGAGGRLQRRVARGAGRGAAGRPREWRGQGRGQGRRRRRGRHADEQQRPAVELARAGGARQGRRGWLRGALRVLAWARVCEQRVFEQRVFQQRVFEQRVFQQRVFQQRACEPGGVFEPRGGLAHSGRRERARGRVVHSGRGAGPGGGGVAAVGDGAGERERERVGDGAGPGRGRRGRGRRWRWRPFAKWAERIERRGGRWAERRGGEERHWEGEREREREPGVRQAGAATQVCEVGTGVGVGVGVGVARAAAAVRPRCGVQEMGREKGRSVQRPGPPEGAGAVRPPSAQMICRWGRGRGRCGAVTA